MQQRRWMYLFALLVPTVVFLSLYWPAEYSYFAVVFLFGFLPLLELFMKGSPQNWTPEQEQKELQNSFYDLLLYFLAFTQFLLLGYYLYLMADPAMALSDKFAKSTAMGMACGILGINLAHELGHRKNKAERGLSLCLLLSSLYMHFYIEHNRGHHKYVATPLDPATARKGESIYAFWLRSLFFSWLSAWRLETKRLKSAGQAPIGLKNQMLVFHLIQLAFLTLLAIVFSVELCYFFLISAFIGILLLESVNYIEHYALLRRWNGKQYERAQPEHSWNSNHPIGRALLLDLSRHSDHHYLASRKYQILRHFDQSPQMPTGYPGMILLAFVPPLWFWLMHKKIPTSQSLSHEIEK